MSLLNLHRSDHAIDLVSERYDLGFRFGNLKDRSLMSRRIGDFDRILISSSSYLDRIPPIETAADLNRCDFVALENLPKGITLVRDEESVNCVPKRTRVVVNTVAAAKASILAGLGVQRLPRTAVEAELESGALVHILPDWHLPTLGVYAIWPQSGPRKRLTQRLLDFLVG